MTEVPDVVSAQGLSGCVVDDCGKKIVGRGRCRRHYVQWWRRSRGQKHAPALNLKTKTPQERFWEKVARGEPGECWPWNKISHKSGHGSFFVSPERGTVPAHSYALELHTGQRCPEGKECCHHCDNPPCCNPAHLYFGTRLQNVHDSIDRGRNQYGVNHAQAVLDDAKVLAIRVLFAAGETQPVLASVYGIGEAYVSDIVNGRTWKHVGGPIKTHNRPGRRPNQKKEAA